MRALRCLHFIIAWSPTHHVFGMLTHILTNYSIFGHPMQSEPLTETSFHFLFLFQFHRIILNERNVYL